MSLIVPPEVASEILRRHDIPVAGTNAPRAGPAASLALVGCAGEDGRRSVILNFGGELATRRCPIEEADAGAMVRELQIPGALERIARLIVNASRMYVANPLILAFKLQPIHLDERECLVDAVRMLHVGPVAAKRYSVSARPAR